MAIKPLTHKQLINKMAKNTHLQPQTVEKVLNCFIDTIAEEMRVTGTCTVNKLGKFHSSFYAGRIQPHTGIWVEERLIPHLRFSDYFKNLMNGRMVTRRGRHDEKNNNVSKDLSKKLKKIKESQGQEVQELLRNMKENGISIEAQLSQKRQEQIAENKRRKQEKLLEKQTKEKEIQDYIDTVNSDNVIL